ncbi:hypothetical protein [Spiroplasma attinicola]|uniref:hypothetical protein n=1 Tax=Spiroplasma attinicola TaxID=2904537 RepID=UPI0020229DD0|nr:hypothetical protein [Spiroplasma sp. JKS002670]MCL8210272.1 hypothetical protein [Spiroplasma sp. JKS002670]
MIKRTSEEDKFTKLFIKTRVEQFIDIDTEKLKVIFSIRSKAKNSNSMIILKMMNLTTLSLQELNYIKNFYVFKTVVLTEKNKVKESMSFPAINYFDMLKNDWCNSMVFKYFSLKTICLFVFQKQAGKQFFKKVVFLNLNSDEIHELFIIWEKVKNMVANNLLVIGGKNGFSVENFPKKEESSVVHIRPHDTNSNEGKVLLPNGKRIMNYCFWLNNNFIEKRIMEEL